MAIFQSIVFEKGRKSAGNATFYRRIGVQIARSKPLPKENPTFTTAQRKQQKVFKFMKANVDASNVISIVNMMYDAKPRSGKSETKYNMFYRSFMPHIVAQKEQIWELENDALVDNSIFLGTSDEGADKLINGILGNLTFNSMSAATLTISAAIMDNIIAKANAQLSEGATPFTTDNVFIAVVGAPTGSTVGYSITAPTKVTLTESDADYSISVSTLTEGMDSAKNIYFIMAIGYAGTGGALDTEQRYFCTDSAVF